jgi:peptidoglycan/LPS O-acetylase OafA/YrhL
MNQPDLARRARPPKQEASGVTTIGYIPGLDGLRAVAVLAVIAYHAGVGWAPGGFLGVDTFFVLSGYLITSLLVGEWSNRGTISLPGFWARRARRLLPALFLVLLAIAAYGAFLAPPDTLGSLRADAMFTLGYAANWHQVVAGQGYFAQAAQPSPLLHTWSLAIEEQFYLVWPLVVLGILKWRKSTRPLLAVCLLGAAASAVEMALLFRPYTDVSRIYYGTDTRAQTILIGAALALVLRSRPRARRLEGQWGLSLLATVGAVVLGWSVVNATGQSPWLFRGGTALVALGVAAIIACVVQHPRSVHARALSIAPVRYVGRISYGLYLWHWPVFVALNHARTGLLGWKLLALRLAVTFAASVLSYHLVESPIRRGAFRSWRAWVLAPTAIGATAVAVTMATALAVPSISEASGLSDTSGQRQSGQTSTLPADTPPHVPNPPIKALLVGDSMAFNLEFGWGLAHTRPYGVDLIPDGVIACGLADSGLVREQGQVETSPDGVFGGGYRPCSEVPDTWRQALTQHPDVVMMFYGPWEVRDRTINGRWTHIGNPDFNAYEMQRLNEAVSVLGSTGAPVVLLTSPYYHQPEGPNGNGWPEDDPNRVNAYNSLLYEVEATHPGVTVLPLGRELSPAGHYQAVIDGVTVRNSDGVHMSGEGSAWLAKWLLPRVVQIAEQDHSVASNPTRTR